MSRPMQLLPEDHPLMVAWNEFKKSEDYANSLKWAQHVVADFDEHGNVKAKHPHIEGSFWNLFMCGWNARGEQPSSPDDH